MAYTSQTPGSEAVWTGSRRIGLFRDWCGSPMTASRLQKTLCAQEYVDYRPRDAESAARCPDLAGGAQPEDGHHAAGARRWIQRAPRHAGPRRSDPHPVGDAHQNTCRSLSPPSPPSTDGLYAIWSATLGPFARRIRGRADEAERCSGVPSSGGIEATEDLP